jgi:hypothetical protein
MWYDCPVSDGPRLPRGCQEPMSREFLFSLIALALALGGVVAWRSRDDANVEREVGESFVVEYQGALGPDGRGGRYLSRRTESGLQRISGRVFDAIPIGDDCVLFSDHAYEVTAVCGDRDPVFIAQFERDVRPRLDPTVVRSGDREYPVDQIKRAAQQTETERVGGGWLAQPSAFPGQDDVPEFTLYREDGYGGTYHWGTPVAAYRSLGDDCLLYVYPGTPGRLGVAATCGRRYDVSLGTVEAPSDIQDDAAVRIDGVVTPLSEIKRRALAERAR